MPKVISLVCPIFNEATVIEIFLKAVQPYLDEALKLIGPDAKQEIIFVDDGSKDASAAIVTAIAATRPDVKLLMFSRNFGKEAALAAGLKYATGDAIIPIDVDLQDPPEVIVEMVKLWLGGAQIVNAMRVNRSSDVWLKRTTANLFYNFFNQMSKQPIPRNVGDFRLLDRVVVDVLNQFTEHNRFMKVLFSWVGYKQKMVEFTRQPRVAGHTKFRYWRLWNFALDGVTGSTTLPLRIWTYFGILMSIFAFAYALYVVLYTLINGVDAPGYASLMAVILTIGAFNFISLGILGEYVGRISEEVRHRPLYIVQETIGFTDKKS